MLWTIKMTECGMNHRGLCGLQSAGNLPFKCSGTEKCPIFRKMLALEKIANKNNYTATNKNELYYTFMGSD